VDADLGSSDESARAWKEFSVLAANEQSLWRELAEAQHQQASLCRVLGRAWATADGIELPTHDASGARLGERFSARAARWGGWAAAAVITMAWVSAMLPGGRAVPGNAQSGGLASVGFNSPQEAFDEYMRVGQKTGRVVGEMPEWVMVDSRPAPTGPGYEVIYLRQIVEKRIVPDLYRFGADEAGRSTLVPVAMPSKPGGAM
jgi:hypothetical protein